MAPSEQRFFLFGEFTFDPHEGLLANGHEATRLASKTCEVLLVLLTRSGELVSKGDLLEIVWKGSFVEEGILTVHISQLRKLLGDDAHNPQYLETVPKKGYKFKIHPEIVDHLSSGNGNSSNGRTSGSRPGALGREHVDEPRAARSKTNIGLALLAAAATGILAYAIIYWPIAATKTVTITKVTVSDAVGFPTISPDGAYVAYSVTKAGKAWLVLKQIGTTSEAMIVPPAEGTYGGVTFTPDGKSIYYSIIEPVTGKMQVFCVAFFGGSNTLIPLRARDVFAVDISPDGSRLAFTAENTEKGESFIKLSQTDGSNESVMAVRPHPSSFQWGGATPDWSPDGNLIAAAYRNGIDSFTRLVTVNAADGTLREFSEHPFHLITGINWLRDMSGLMLSARGENGANGQLWFVEYPTGKARQITHDGNDYLYLKLSDDGKSMVALQNEAQSQLWIVDAVADLLAPPVEQLSIKADSAMEISDVKVDGWPGLGWTPDGRVIFTSKASGNWDIWVMNSDGTDRSQLTTHERHDLRPSVSWNGKVVFMSTRSGAEQVWMMNPDGSEQTQLTFGSIARHPSISPDGQWAVFTAGPSGIETLWKTSAVGGELVKLTDKASSRPWISPDGKFIVYNYYVNNRGRIAVISSDGGPPVYDLDLDPSPGFEPLVKWLPGGNGLSLVKTEKGVGNIWAVSLDGKQRRQVTDFKSDVIWNYSWSHDGMRLLLARGRQVKDVVLMRLTPD